jgi:predicted dehydrogenase
MKGIHIGLVGCGNWGRHILRDLNALGCRVTVVAREEKSIENARKGNADRLVGSVEELCEISELRGFVVATPSVSHFHVTRALIAARPNLPIFVEKPATVSVADAETLLRLKPHGIFIMEKWRYHPGILKLAEIAKSGILGRVLGIKAERLGWGNPHSDIHSVWHLLPHDLAIIDEVLGSLPSITAVHVQRVGEFCSGINLTLGSTPWACCITSSHSPLRIRRVQLVCEDGVALMEGADSKSLRIARGPLDSGDITPAFTEIPLADTMPLFAELENFVGYVAGACSAPKAPLHESIRIVHLIENALKWDHRHA